MISPDQLLSGRKFRDVDVVTVTPTSLSARVDGKLVEVDLGAKPDLCAEVQAIAPGAKTLRIAQASLESVRAAELTPGRTEAWLVVADPKPDAKIVGFAAPASLLSAMPRAVQRGYASGLTQEEIAAWPNLCALIDEATSDGGQSSSRNGASVDALQMHHSTMSSARAYVQLVQGLLRQVSSNLAIDVDGRIIRVVNLLRRAWTSGSASFDARAITVETANETIGDASGWKVSEAAKNALARVAAALKLDRALQALTTNNVYQHREMNPRWGVSYQTGCTWDISAADIIRRANSGALPTATLKTGGTKMDLLEEGGKVYLVNEHGMLWVDPDVANAVVKIKTASPNPGKLTFTERAKLERALHELARSGPLVGDDDYGKITKAVKG